MALIGDTAVNLFCENEPSEKVQLRSLVSINRHLSFPLSAAPAAAYRYPLAGFLPVNLLLRNQAAGKDIRFLPGYLIK